MGERALPRGETPTLVRANYTGKGRVGPSQGHVALAGGEVGLARVPEDVRLVQVTSDDLELLRQIARLSLVAWRREPSACEIETRAETLRRELEDSRPDERAAFAARRSGVTVGFVKTCRGEREHGTWLLVSLAVHPEYRRQGIGRALVGEAIRHACENGAVEVRSQTHADNEAAIRFHEALGFTNEGPVVGADGDALVAFRLATIQAAQ